MKKFDFRKIMTALLLFTTAFFAGCNSEDVDYDYARLEVTPEIIEFEASGAPTADGNKITITTSRDWTIALEDQTVDWIGFSEESGYGDSEVTLTLLPNNTESARQTRVRIDASIRHAYVTVSQRTGSSRAELYYETFNNVEDNNRVAIGSVVGFDEPDATYSGTVDVRSTGALGNHVWFGAGAGSLKIENINTAGYSNLTLSYDITANLFNAGESANVNQMSVLVNGQPVEVPNVTLTNEEGYFTKYYNVTIPNVPDGLSTLEFVTTTTNERGLRLDNIRLTGMPGGTPGVLSFGRATISGQLTAGTEASAVQVSIPYYYAEGQSYDAVAVAVAGAGSAGLSVEVTNPVVLGNGSGSLTFDVTGTPTTEGEVTFTVTGITELTSPNNVATGTVAAAGSGGGELYFETFDNTGTANVDVEDATGYDEASATYTGNTNIRATNALGRHVWFAAGSDRNLNIANINTAGYTNLTLSFDITANVFNATDIANVNWMSVTANGTALAMPDVTLSREGGHFDSYYNVTVSVPDGLNTLEFSTGSTTTVGMRVDNIKVTGTTGGTPGSLSFGAAALTGNLTAGSPASGVNISIPYTNAAGESYSGVAVAITGAGAAGLNVNVTNPVTLGTGNGTLNLSVTGTPTTAGAVTFTITGITELTAPNNAVSGSVAPAGSSGGIYSETFNNTGTGTVAIASATGFDEAAATYAGNTDVRNTGTLDRHVWFASTTAENPTRTLTVSNINTAGYTGLSLSFDITANLYNAGAVGNVNWMSVTANGTALTLPNVELSRETGYYNIYYTVTIDNIPDGLNTLEFSTGATNTLGMRVDNIRVTGTPGTTPTAPVFSAGSLTGTLTVGEAANGVLLTIPYTGATAQSYAAVSVDVSGAGAAGLSVPVTNPVVLATGDGSLTFSVTGTPTAEGAVTFTVNGIEHLTSPNNVINGTVAAATPTGEFFNETFGYSETVPGNSTVANYTQWAMSGYTYTDPYGTGASVRTTTGLLETNNMHLWMPANREAGLRIEGIASGYTGMTLTYDIAAGGLTSDVIEVLCNGVPILLPSYAMTSNTTFTTVEVRIPDNTTTLEFYSNPETNSVGFRLDNIKISGTMGGTPSPLSFGRLSIDGEMTATQAATGVALSLPYYNASGQSYPGVSVAVSGAGSAGMSVTPTNPVTLQSGVGIITFDVTGTPTTAGEVTFTVNGIAELSAPNNSVTTEVAELPGEQIIVDFTTNDVLNLPTSKPAETDPDHVVTIDGREWSLRGAYFNNSGYMMLPGSGYTPKGHVIIPVLEDNKTIRSAVITTRTGASSSVVMAFQAMRGGEWVTLQSQTMPAGQDVVFDDFTTVAGEQHRFVITSNHNSQWLRLTLNVE